MIERIERIERIFSLLDKNNIRYYLLRPIDFRDEIKDVDIIVLKDDLLDLKELLLKTYGIFFFKKSDANASVEIKVDEIVLDIKFHICFLPGKALILYQKAPYSGVKYKTKGIMVPDVQDELLFTFWTYHLFLDKTSPEGSSTIDIYKDWYSNRWKEFKDSEFFQKWTKILFKARAHEAIGVLEVYFLEGVSAKQGSPNKLLKNLLFKARPILRGRFFFNRVKYAIYRRLRVHGNYRKISRTTYQ